MIHGIGHSWKIWIVPRMSTFCRPADVLSTPQVLWNISKKTCFVLYFAISGYRPVTIVKTTNRLFTGGSLIWFIFKPYYPYTLPSGKLGEKIVIYVNIKLNVGYYFLGIDSTYLFNVRIHYHTNCQCYMHADNTNSSQLFWLFPSRLVFKPRSFWHSVNHQDGQGRQSHMEVQLLPSPNCKSHISFAKMHIALVLTVMMSIDLP